MLNYDVLSDIKENSQVPICPERQNTYHGSMYAYLRLKKIVVRSKLWEFLHIETRMYPLFFPPQLLKKL